MTFTTQALVEGPVFDSALRFAADYTEQQQADNLDPIIEMGWAATLIPEQEGGAGGNLDDLVAIIDGLGQHALALPLLERCALTPLLLAAVEQPAIRRRWLNGIANGTYAVSTLCTTQPDLGLGALNATIDLSGERFQGPCDAPQDERHRTDKHEVDEQRLQHERGAAGAANVNGRVLAAKQVGARARRRPRPRPARARSPARQGRPAR